MKLTACSITLNGRSCLCGLKCQLFQTIGTSESWTFAQSRHARGCDTTDRSMALKTSEERIRETTCWGVVENPSRAEDIHSINVVGFLHRFALRTQVKQWRWTELCEENNFYRNVLQLSVLNLSLWEANKIHATSFVNFSQCWSKFYNSLRVENSRLDFVDSVEKAKRERRPLWFFAPQNLLQLLAQRRLLKFRKNVTRQVNKRLRFWFEAGYTQSSLWKRQIPSIVLPVSL